MSGLTVDGGSKKLDPGPSLKALLLQKQWILTLGMLSWLQSPSDRRRSRISQAKIDGHSRLYCAMRVTTSGVATRGLLPPIARGRMEPVS